MRADNQGEGGILALTALLPQRAERRPRTSPVLVLLGIFGAALLYGDGMITPAITVLGAVEGLRSPRRCSSRTSCRSTVVHPDRRVRDPAPRHRRGRAAVRAGHGALVRRLIAVLGVVWHRARTRSCYGGRSPARRGVLPRARLARLRGAGRGVPGGHRRRGALRRHGPLRQAADPPRLVRAGAARAAAQLLRPGRAAADQPEARSSSPFFLLAPSGRCCRWSALATAAAIIASQALISGAFSLTRQAMQLGYCPRLDIEHTSSHEIGQIYVPQVNWALMVCTIADRHRLRIVERAGGRVRHRGDADDGDHRACCCTSSRRERWRWPPGVGAAR